jgi:hypothetical protein
MRSDVLQAITICLHGNAYLADPVADRASELMGTNSLFKSVFEMIFERHVIGSRNVTIVGGPVAPWLRRLKSEDVEELRLHLGNVGMQSDRSKDGHWGIVTDGNTGTELWEPVWKGRLVRYGEPPSFKVTYHAERVNRWTIPVPTPSAKTATNLLDKLVEIREVALSADLAGVASLCARCLELQEEGSTVCPGFPDLLPNSISPDARRIMSSAARVMVVLGSGAWGDGLQQVNQTVFRAKTHELWRASLECFESLTYRGEWAKRAS